MSTLIEIITNNWKHCYEHTARNINPKLDYIEMSTLLEIITNNWNHCYEHTQQFGTK